MPKRINSKPVLRSVGSLQNDQQRLDGGMNRRSVLQRLSIGTVGLALSPFTLGQMEIPAGQIRLIFNENPYGPSPKALAAVPNNLPKTAYYPGAI